MTETKLKPCPFCGGKAVTEIVQNERYFEIYCSRCPVKINLPFCELNLGDGSVVSFDEMARAIDELTNLWNRRATDGKAEAD